MYRGYVHTDILENGETLQQVDKLEYKSNIKRLKG